MHSHDGFISGQYSFRPLTPADMPMLRTWLHTPEVKRWWGDPAHEEKLLLEDMHEPLMVTWVVSYKATPFAYAQHYDVASWAAPHFAHLPKGTRAVDTFIGVPDMLGAGHGGRFLNALAEHLVREGAPMVAIDPDEDNIRARKAYGRAGFKGDELVETGEGPAILMTYSPG
ncbi:GNAT family N-acetyltransferase [Kordiimonas sp.]|uniref:GNAT family N-acetyltransferase n=1 Tax=Kordiimonas sp. TaxID=1970157 RepID=UPI003A8D8CB2